jgi:hypothetical protein
MRFRVPYAARPPPAAIVAVAGPRNHTSPAISIGGFKQGRKLSMHLKAHWSAAAFVRRARNPGFPRAPFQQGKRAPLLRLGLRPIGTQRLRPARAPSREAQALTPEAPQENSRQPPALFRKLRRRRKAPRVGGEHGPRGHRLKKLRPPLPPRPLRLGQREVPRLAQRE